MTLLMRFFVIWVKLIRVIIRIRPICFIVGVILVSPIIQLRLRVSFSRYFALCHIRPPSEQIKNPYIAVYELNYC